ncbi:GyrI-like domain-containing protein [uncultured Polaribacter sp.]|uniref:GyrI-like domain-containing protein n=1 Tax=uncultured Polaribacter sp. TaxID=174711 RepID=UPI002614D79F|nr:GyrI-like domain-containing protein [uncultured Polaribacter sp.]
MKHEWRKKEKQVYIPKAKPEQIVIPEYNFFTISGKGNPNSNHFTNFIAPLYALSYGVKMSLKQKPVLENYFDYTVYPLEGVWDISEKAKKNFNPNSPIDKDKLIFTLMIRQPNFVTRDYALEMIKKVTIKKPALFIDQVKFVKIAEGNCVQMLHIGSYDNEATTFKIMEEFAEQHNLERQSKIHREIYVSDFRKVAIEKLKTVLRFKVK